MEKSNHTSSRKVDQLITAHLQTKQAENQLSQQFNMKLMDKIEALEEAPSSSASLVFAEMSLFIPVILLCVVILGTFGYYMAGTDLNLFQNVNVSIDSSFFLQKGFKYSLYSLIALLGFSLLDHFIQLKTQHSRK